MAIKKTNEQMLEDVRQQLNRVKLREREIKNRIKTEERKKRNHAFILITAEMLKFYDKDIKKYLINTDDEAVKIWVKIQMQKPKEAEYGLYSLWLFSSATGLSPLYYSRFVI